MSLRDVATEFATYGLILRGGFAVALTDTPQTALGGAEARAVLLVGQRGAEPWPYFKAWLGRQPAKVDDPLDDWSRMVIGTVADRFGARGVSPSDRPYLPFQQWAIRAEGLRPSPLAILMHPEYGLWHAYRGALLFGEGDIAYEIASLPERAIAPVHLCDACEAKPCLSACPVGAYTRDGFEYEGCLTHVRSERGEPCRSTGCLDRNACPYGTEWRYPPDVQAFHMNAFLRV